LDGTLYGIEEIALVELQTVADEELNDMRIRRSKDVFTSYERENGIPGDEVISRRVSGSDLQERRASAR
jgi:hypothetical protein